MQMNRRQTLLGGAGALAMSAAPASFALAAADFEMIRPRPRRLRLLPEDYPATEVWSYGDAVPGPEIRVRQGARVQRRLVNDLPAETTIHWHGIRLENAMDGVPGLPQGRGRPGRDLRL